MAELPVEMPNLLKFPMGQLCYDLVLEVMDELDPKDVPELMKVDRRFRWIHLRKPIRILGKQVLLNSVEMDGRGSLDDERKRYQDRVFIMKFAESRPLPFYFLSHKVLLLSQVERCSLLKISEAVWGFIDRKKLSALKKAFANLKQVDELKVEIRGNNFNDFLWNLKAEVTDRASLNFSYSLGETHPQLVLSLIKGSLQNCKMISMDLDHDSVFYPALYSALSKTRLELFITDIYSNDAKSTIEWILNSGIPSENKEAACWVRGRMEVIFHTLIKNLPEIRQVNEPNKTFFRDTMIETLRKHGFMVECCDRSRSRVRSISVSAESLSDSDHSGSVSEHSRSDCDDSRSDSDHSRHSMDRSPMKRGVEHYESLSLSAESLSVTVPAESLSVSVESLSDSDHSGSVSEDSRSDSDHSLDSMDLSPIERRIQHCVYLDGSFDCYLKRIDEKRDCIYVVNHNFSFAKYVSSIQF